MYVHTSLLSPSPRLQTSLWRIYDCIWLESHSIMWWTGPEGIEHHCHQYLSYKNVIEGPWYLMTSTFTDSSIRKLEGGVGEDTLVAPPSNMPTCYAAKIFPV